MARRASLARRKRSRASVWCRARLPDFEVWSACVAAVPFERRITRARIFGLARDMFGYALVSALALALDWGLLVALARFFGVQYLIASAISFSAGLILAYVLSAVFVFKGRRKHDARVEFGGFLVTGLLGLALTQILLLVFVGRFHLPVEWAKAPVACVVFSFNFLTRRLLFTAPTQPA
ncbi:MAG: GtrA family protein [Hyphomicrobiales bacterium]|nr:GtrA family protein [Hyphomicrobiales bacterium]